MFASRNSSDTYGLSNMRSNDPDPVKPAFSECGNNEVVPVTDIAVVAEVIGSVGRVG